MLKKRAQRIPWTNEQRTDETNELNERMNDWTCSRYHCCSVGFFRISAEFQASEIHISNADETQDVPKYHRKTTSGAETNAIPFVRRTRV